MPLPSVPTDHACAETTSRNYPLSIRFRPFIIGQLLKKPRFFWISLVPERRNARACDQLTSPVPRTLGGERILVLPV